MGSGRRVMLVDDNLDALETLAEVLRFSDFEVATAATPRAALALAPQFLPDVAVLDVSLPGMDGFELARALRAASGPALRLITLSGHGSAEDHRRAAAAGLERHLVKPVDLDQMIAILEGKPAVS
ncbi:response regulator [Pelomonas sp. KK5]|uniref:response regulator n=1 Tax=Pelomonas sp. KK5 TaxID=1855730 RepID=UPI0009FA02E1|nr:response regulator [Pelomonas sp. KK5]